MIQLPDLNYTLPDKPLSEITADDYPPYMRDAIKEVEEMAKHPYTFEEFIAQCRRNSRPLEEEVKDAKTE